MKTLRLFAVALIFSALMGCASMTPEERKEWTAIGTSAARSVVTLGLNALSDGKTTQEPQQ